MAGGTLADDLNSLIKRKDRGQSALAERTDRGAIAEHKGSGRSVAAEDSASGNNIIGDFITTDGLFTLVITADG